MVYGLNSSTGNFDLAYVFIYYYSFPDNDNDGVTDNIDECLGTPTGETVDANGCSLSQLADDDGDGVMNDVDQCPNTPTGETVDSNGCSDSQLDDDGDNVMNDADQCPNTPTGETPDAKGCSSSQLDDDSDGVMNDIDQCSDTPTGETPDAKGCSDSQLDDDGDSVMNDVDQCPNTPTGETVDTNGCPINQEQNCNNLKLTASNYGETEDLDQKVKTEFGNDFSLADWNDIKSIQDLDTWASCMNLTEDMSFMVTKDGNDFYGSTRHYYVQYSTDGLPYSGFLAHDKIGDFYLGSWYGISLKVLAKKTVVADDDGDGVMNDVDQCPNTPNGATVDANGCEITSTNYYTSEFFDLNDNQVPNGWEYINSGATDSDISNGRINAYIIDGSGYLKKTSKASNITKEIVLEMDALFVYSYWGNKNMFQINFGDKFLQFRAGEEDYDHPIGFSADEVIFNDGTSSVYIYESTSPMVYGTYHLTLRMNATTYEFLGINPNGDEAFKINIDPSLYFDFTQIDELKFMVTCTTDNSGWIDNLRITVIEEQLGIDDALLDKSVKMYPNPVTNMLSVSSRTIPITKVEIYSVLGKRVKTITKDFNTIQTEDLSSGLYLIRIYSENGSLFKKLFKK